MVKLHARAKLVEGFRFDVDDCRSHAICLDLPLDEGTDLGPTALELALMSYAGCYATIFALTASKMRIQMQDLQVEVEGIKSEEAGTIIEVRFNINVRSDAPEDRIRRAHDLTLNNCPVGKIFENAGIKQTYDLKANY